MPSRSEIRALYRQSNRERIREQQRRHYAFHREAILASNRAWVEANRDAVQNYRTNYCKSRRREDPVYRLQCNLRCRFRNALKRNFKSGSAVRDLGCTIPELKLYLEARFAPGMTWDNYGAWHVDHIKPLASFDLTDREQLLRACHYTNLQPLWAGDNLRKGAR